MTSLLANVTTSEVKELQLEARVKRFLPLIVLFVVFGTCSIAGGLILPDAMVGLALGTMVGAFLGIIGCVLTASIIEDNGPGPRGAAG